MNRNHAMTASPVTASKNGSLPQRKAIRVAFLLGDHANAIDTIGPWEVFQDAVVEHRHPFRLYTVASSESSVRMSGGLKIVPHYTLANAPSPHVIVVPAQRSTASSRRWLKQASQSADITLSICTGAFQLARAGLLDGLAATTHHDFWDAFASKFPDIELHRGARFVDNGRIATAAGLTSGIDLALHVVARYFGADVASATAKYMEHDSAAWRPLK